MRIFRTHTCSHPIISLLLGVCLLGWITPRTAWATHFMGGHLTWKPRPDLSSSTVEFTLIINFRRDAFFGLGFDLHPVTGNLITPAASQYNLTSLVFGDGSETGTLTFRVIAYNVDENWITVQALDPSTNQTTILHRYPSPDDHGKPWIAGVVGEERISNTVNAPDELFKMRTLVETRTGNRAPVAGNVAPVLIVTENTVVSLAIPVTDSDAGSRLQFRLATNDESGIQHQPGPPNAPRALTVDAATGVVSWNTAGAAPGTGARSWSTQIIVEDRSTTTGALLTQVAVDFVIRVLPVNDPPVLEFIPDKTINENARLAFKIRATDPEGEWLSFSMKNAPSGAQLRSGTQDADFSWTPSSRAAGASYVVTFVVTELFGSNRLSDQQDVRITVVAREPDLVAGELQGELKRESASLKAGTPYRAVAVISNKRRAFQESFRVAFLLDGVLAADTTLEGMQIDQETSFSAPITCYDLGSHTVDFVVDVDDDVAEFSEDNNESQISVDVVRGNELIVRPNPFTPNGDGFNDQVKFDYSHFGLQAPNLKILTFEGRLIRTIRDTQDRALYWNGNNENGVSQMPGVYIYVLEDGTEMVARGSIALAR